MECSLCNALNESYRIVHKDEHVAVIINYEPVKHGHVMVMPIRHAERLGDLNPGEAQMFLQTIDRCMRMMQSFSDESPICLVNDGKHRSQSHLHAHVLPSKQPLRGLFMASEGLEERKRADRETLTRMADELRRLYF